QFKLIVQRGAQRNHHALIRQPAHHDHYFLPKYGVASTHSLKQMRNGPWVINFRQDFRCPASNVLHVRPQRASEAVDGILSDTNQFLLGTKAIENVRVAQVCYQLRDRLMDTSCHHVKTLRQPVLSCTYLYTLVQGTVY